jgi:hypothetical protein
MMKNKSTLAKLLAEEDIFVVHKQTPTAYFDVKRRELGLPIWKDEEMTNNIYDLMVCHEIAHALWTPLEMMEEVISRNLNKSVVNILEDARIEKMVQKKYPGSVGIFNRGYAELGEKNFFGVEGEDISKLTLADRINLFFKKQKGVTFSDEENVFVKKTNELETTEDVLTLAEEIYKWMEDRSTEEENSEGEDGSAGDTGESSEGTSSSSEEGEGKGKSEESKGEGKEDGDGNSSAPVGNNGDDDSETGDGETEVGNTEGGVESDGTGSVPVKTDTDSNNAIDKLRDETAQDRMYGRIAPIPTDTIVSFKTCVEELGANYDGSSNELFYSSTLEEVTELKAASKKTVGYMVKEFEMKKSADQYARAATAKTGTLDMGALHTYKFNDDLFKKVTTLPGATNHGMVMVLDWSGSMAENLIGTLSQLYNLIWFCRRTQIPFKVYAFSDAYGRKGYYNNSESSETNVEYGEIEYNQFKLLEFFSSDMTGNEENRMMHYLWMVASRWIYRDWTEKGYPIDIPYKFSLGGTPLNDAIMAMTTIVPKFKNETGVQKVNTIFLTDGASSRHHFIRDYNMVDGNDVARRLYGSYKTIITNPKNGKTYEMTGDNTNDFLRILKDSVDGMNLVGFFIAGSGRSGRIDKRTISYVTGINVWDDKMSDILKKVNKEKYFAVEGGVTGYDEYYLLAGGRNLEVENETLDNELVGASKAKLKSAFGKMTKGKVQSRTLLNRFVKLVA